MPPKKRNANAAGAVRRASQATPAAARSIDDDVQAALDWLKRHVSRKTLDGMARYGLPSDHALGVSMADIQALAKRLGRDHDLAAGLWKTGVFEARMLTAFVDEPERVTAAQMDRWCRDFDNWGICDTLCFHLFDRTPHAWAKVAQWAGSPDEFVRRTAFALLWSLALHDKGARDEQFLEGLRLIERAADDERNFVKKAVNMALRAVGRRSPAVHAAAVATARRLSGATEPTPRWIGKHALRELTGPAALKRVAAQRERAGS